MPLFIFVLPGVIAYALAKTGRISLDTPDHALPTLVGALLPAGLRGLVVAGLLAALMSSLSSVFNSCSTLITLDIYKKMHPSATERQLVLVGQLATGMLIIFGFLWIPLIKNISGTLYQYLQSVQAYISPPIAAAFLLGIFFKRLNSRGAMASLLLGFVLGMARLFLEINKSAIHPFFQKHPGLNFLRSATFSYADINFLHFAVFLFIICSAVLILVSLTAPGPSDKKLENLTYWTTSKSKANSLWQRQDVWLSILLAGVVGLVWIVFKG
ncbi:MAG: hypothetical protein D6814_08680 [Calditrichaeota bacterium]|nr:MAG: hypothetical protein D6814_08680 [Calditrichota bacterium]